MVDGAGIEPATFRLSVEGSSFELSVRIKTNGGRNRFRTCDFLRLTYSPTPKGGGFYLTPMFRGQGFYDTDEDSPSATGLISSLVRVDAPTRRTPFLLGRCAASDFIFSATECMFFAALKSLADEASALSDQRNSLPLVVRWLSAYVVVRSALRARPLPLG